MFFFIDGCMYSTSVVYSQGQRTNQDNGVKGEMIRWRLLFSSAAMDQSNLNMGHSTVLPTKSKVVIARVLSPHSFPVSLFMRGKQPDIDMVW